MTNDLKISQAGNVRKNEEVHGGEFDWFARDKNGNFALFATAGGGFVPDKALSLAVTFESISNSIDAPNWGAFNVWNDYADLGLYVFDWQLPEGPYVRVHSPTGSGSGSVLDRLAGIGTLPKFDGVFENTPSVEEWQST